MQEDKGKEETFWRGLSKLDGFGHPFRGNVIRQIRS